MAWLLIGYIIIINIVAFCLFGIDKSAAKAGRERIPNKVLLGLAVAGGSAGALLGMIVFRHKTRKWYYAKVVPLLLLVQIAIAVFGLSAFVAATASRDIAGMDTGSVVDGGSGIDAACIDECKSIDPQCILVLGCAVWADNQPSPMLKDRLDTAIELYNAGVAPKLLLSGDNSIVEYSEPDCMLQYALAQGVPAEDIFLDYAGFSTYESCYRAEAVFKAERVIVVTQKYHLFRALHICEALGIEAKGFASNQRKYAGRYVREAREVLARDKDYVKSAVKAKPTFLGDEIPIDGDGTVTHIN